MDVEKQPTKRVSKLSLAEQKAKQRALDALENDENWSWAQWRAVAVGT